MAIRKSLLILLFILLPCSAWATNYYISAAGSGSSCTSESPCALATAVAAATSGETIFFKSDDTWTSSGSPTVFAAVAGVTYDGATYGTGTRATLVAGAAGTSDSSIVTIAVSNVVIKGFNINGNQKKTSGLYIGMGATANISGITVDNCVIHDNGDPANDDWVYGVNVGAKASSPGITVSNVSVTNTEIYNTGHEGAACYASWGYPGNVADTVLFRNLTVHDTGTTATGAGIGFAVVNGCSNLTIEYSRSYNNDKGLWLRNSPEGENGSPTNIVVRHNIFYNNGASGLEFTNGSALQVTANVYSNIIYNNGSDSQGSGIIIYPQGWTTNTVLNIYNNTIYDAIEHASGLSHAVAVCRYTDAPGDTPVINFKNNIVYMNTTADIIPLYDRYGWLVHSNNLIQRASGSVLVQSPNATTYTAATIDDYEATAVTGDPSFTGGTLPTGFSGTYGSNMVPNTDYFQLTVDSPAKDTGATLEGYTGSINGAGLTTPIVRPLGAAFDIGAYEYGTVAQSGGSAGSGFKLQGVTLR